MPYSERNAGKPSKTKFNGSMRQKYLATQPAGEVIRIDARGDILVLKPMQELILLANKLGCDVPATPAPTQRSVYALLQTRVAAFVAPVLERWYIRLDSGSPKHGYYSLTVLDLTSVSTNGEQCQWRPAGANMAKKARLLTTPVDDLEWAH
eukprot:COSAG06_NODE_4917_length_3859_cov_2.785638_4_plen_151_part_00